MLYVNTHTKPAHYFAAHVAACSCCFRDMHVRPGANALRLALCQLSRLTSWHGQICTQSERLCNYCGACQLYRYANAANGSKLMQYKLCTSHRGISQTL